MKFKLHTIANRTIKFKAAVKDYEAKRVSTTAGTAATA
jgi:hypothetical protein